MVLAYHVVFGTYGFWLPNDPRGSWSSFVGAWELFCFGRATKVVERRSLANARHDHELREAAKRALRYPPVVLTDRQAVLVARGFDRARNESGYVILACAIMPEHVHLVLGRKEDRKVERMTRHLKTRARQELSAAGLWHEDGRPLWGENLWKVFLDTPDDIAAAVKYVEENPIKEGKPPQNWPFIEPLVV